MTSKLVYPSKSQRLFRVFGGFLTANLFLHFLVDRFRKDDFAQIIMSPIRKNWVIKRFADALLSEMTFGITKINYVPKLKCKINIWIHYRDVNLDLIRRIKGLHYVLITHVDTKAKIEIIESLHKLNARLVFMSDHHLIEVKNKIAPDNSSNWYAVSPGTDLNNHRSKTRICLATNLYPDGRKNEKLLLRLAQKHDLSKFHFSLVGLNWEYVKEQIENAGATVDVFSTKNNYSYDRTIREIANCDLFVYLGFDEGSLGTLDAHAIQKQMLISNQGFHTYLKGKHVTKFNDFHDFENKFFEFSKFCTRFKLQEELGEFRTWNNFATEINEIVKADLKRNGY